MFIPPSKYGYGDPAPIKSLVDAVGVNKKLLFVDNDLGPTVTDVINKVADPVRQSGKQVKVLRSNDDLFTECRPNLQGQSSCFGAVVFNDFAEPGSTGSWNYTIRADPALYAQAIKVNNHNNAPQNVILPLQLAVDNAINNSTVIPEEFLYTSRSEKERQDLIRIRYMGALIKVLGVAFFISMVGVTYHLTGLLAAEREHGLSQLICE